MTTTTKTSAPANRDSSSYLSSKLLDIWKVSYPACMIQIIQAAHKQRSFFIAFTVKQPIIVSSVFMEQQIHPHLYLWKIKTWYLKVAIKWLIQWFYNKDCCYNADAVWLVWCQIVSNTSTQKTCCQYHLDNEFMKTKVASGSLVPQQMSLMSHF